MSFIHLMIKGNMMGLKACFPSPDQPDCAAAAILPHKNAKPCKTTAAGGTGSQQIAGMTGQRVAKDLATLHMIDQKLARRVNGATTAANLRGALPELERPSLFPGNNLRAGLASSAEVDVHHVQKQLGHTSAEMTRRYQCRRDRFRVNPTKAAGL